MEGTKDHEGNLTLLAGDGGQQARLLARPPSATNRASWNPGEGVRIANAATVH